GGTAKAHNPPAKPSSPPAAKGKPGSATPPAGANHTACRHTASRDVAGSAKKVKVTVTGTNGASQTTTFPVRRIRSVIRIGRQMSISAFGARGIRIAGIHFDRRGLMSAHRLGVTVTVRDRRHYLVRDAVVMLQSVAHRLSINGS